MPERRTSVPKFLHRRARPCAGAGRGAVRRCAVRVGVTVRSQRRPTKGSGLVGGGRLAVVVAVWWTVDLYANPLDYSCPG